MTAQFLDRSKFTVRFFSEARSESDKLMNYFLAGFFVIGLVLAFFYDTWEVGIGIGGLSLMAYYSAKLTLPKTNFYQYILSVVLGIFMAQYIYQMHGMFEMHFIAFIASALLITYQNWKLQIPLAIAVVLHHAVFGYLQFKGVDKVYFTQLEYMSLETFIIHGFLAATVFFICGLWAYKFEKYSTKNIEQSYEIGRLGEEKLKREAIVQSELRLAKANRELANVFNTINDVVFSVDVTNLKITHMSAACEKIYGYKAEEFYADVNFWNILIHPDDKYMLDEHYKKLQAGMESRNQYRIIHKDKSVRWLENSVIPTLDRQGKLVRLDGITSDITTRKEAEEEIKASEDRYRQVTENRILGIAWASTKGKVLNVNDAFCNMLGYSYLEMLDMHFSDFTHPEDVKMELPLIEKIMKGEMDNYQVEKRYLSKNKEVIWTDLNLSCTRNKNGEIQYFIGIIQDITARKNAEAGIIALNESLERKVLDRTSQLEAAVKELEAFTYSVSHDLRAPLRIIHGFGKILMRKNVDKLDKDSQENLEAIMKNAKQMGQLIDDLLNFSKLGRTPVERNSVNMYDIVRAIVSEVSTADPDNKAEIKLQELKPANCDPALIKQVWINLVSNAVKYSRKKEKPQIEIGTIGENGHTTYYVKDNGAGFDMEHSEKLFGVFQRLHKVSEYEGTGVGLALVQRIVDRHGGKIWAEAQVDKGATFFFTLPNQQ